MRDIGYDAPVPPSPTERVQESTDSYELQNVLKATRKMFQQLKFGSTITPEDVAEVSFALMAEAPQLRPHLRLASGPKAR